MLAAQAGKSTSDPLAIPAHLVAASAVPPAASAGKLRRSLFASLPTLCFAIDDGVSAQKTVALTVFNDMSCGRWLA